MVIALEKKTRSECKNDYYRKNKEKLKERSKKYYAEHKEYYQTDHFKQMKRDWIGKNVEHFKWTYQEYRRKLKIKAFQMISNLLLPKCSECGCTDMRVLEINHKNLDGNKERCGFGHDMYREVVFGRRKTDDLEVLCRVCNAKHYVEKKFGLRFEIKFIGLGLPEVIRTKMRDEN